LNTRAENAVYIADNQKKDFIAPNRLGLSTIELVRPARIHTSISHVPGAAAQHKTHQISQIPAIIERL
jgi:putative hydrolase of the HAD superfamily